MAAYRRVYDSRHLQADCQGTRSAPEPYTLSNRVRTTFHFFLIAVGSWKKFWRQTLVASRLWMGVEGTARDSRALGQAFRVH